MRLTSNHLVTTAYVAASVSLLTAFTLIPRLLPKPPASPPNPDRCAALLVMANAPVRNLAHHVAAQGKAHIELGQRLSRTTPLDHDITAGRAIFTQRWKDIGCSGR